MQTTEKTSAVSDIPSGEELIARARALIPVLRERAALGDERRSLPEETIADMEAAGLFRVLQPKRYGGYEMSPNVFYDIVMTLAEGDMSAGWVYSVVAVHAWQMALFDDRAAQEVWGKDSNVRISSSYMPTGRGKPVEGGFIFSGRWGYSSGCDHCDWVFLGGFVETPEGQPIDARTWLIPRKDYEIVDTWQTSGLKGTGSKDIVIKDVFVPDYRTHKMVDGFTCQSPGNAVNTSTLYRLPFGQVFSRAVSTAAIGALRGMLDCFMETAKTRVNVIGLKTSDDSAAQLVIAEASNAIDELTLVLRRNFEVLEGYAARGESASIEERVKFRFQASYPPERISHLASRLFKAAGGAAVYTKNPYGRFLADINVGRQHAANQFAMFGANWAKVQLGAQNQDFFL
ncbi:acyl-CoA dehydrogenase family protein [Pseudomonas sp. 5P_3.1_Bac2]|uniref:acyl-CoA dehydrogenase family protein n=1 Tax=Pseudomonas sp. 5P_3.1_Bac2 TaxID=2971617 RepID=UPI0021C90271|nr:acyl-CoA dehydrogenase family protein [Pseudomonas sp. 5P_3.1_Bac2]MCU1717652.1 flavin-dependent monooxygenase [Pseudomonas sp. 5P_3.1_Bac2]